MDWKALVSTVAPWIGTALAGPLGGAALGAVADALGLSDKTEASIKAALSGVTPEQMLAIKNADQVFALKMQELGYKQISDMEALAVGDRKDARDMQKTTRSWVPATLSLIVTLGYFGILAGMLGGVFNVTDSEALLIMLGSLSTAWGVVMAFWFGTTSDSGRKTELLAKSAPVQP